MANLSDFLEVWKKHGRPREITVCEADWIELLMNVNTHEVVRDVTGPYMVLVGCIVRPPRTPVATVDLSGERVFHADV